MNSSTTFLVACVNPEYNGKPEFQAHVFTSHVANWRIQNAISCCETVARFSFAQDLPLNARVRWHPRNVDQSRKQVFAKKFTFCKNFAIAAENFWAAPRLTF